MSSLQIYFWLVYLQLIQFKYFYHVTTISLCRFHRKKCLLIFLLFFQVENILTDTAEIVAEVAEGPGKQRVEIWIGLEKREKISQTINDDLCFLFS
jgi:hypothetical protein